jgi:hypothetical protein
MAQDEWNLVFVAEISDPVPGEKALDADDNVCTEWGEGIEQELFVSRDLGLTDDLAGLVEHADGEESGMEVDTAVKLMRLVVEVHG